MLYSKPFMTYSNQVENLQSRGLIINDLNKAELILKQINYYRFSAYALQFQDVKDRFNQGTTIEDILGLYEFDSKLRWYLFTWLEKVEIKLRTFVTYYIGQHYGSFGHIENINFSPHFRHNKWINKLENEQNRSSETFIKHYNEKYKDSPDLPIWMATEIMSMGSLSRLLAGMKKQDQKRLASIIDLHAPVIINWFHHLTYIRNLCAHHSRIWNRELAIKPKKPDDLVWNFLLDNNNRIFASLSILIYLSDKFELELPVKKTIVELLDRYSYLPFCVKTGMGFPENYESVWLWGDKG